MRSLLATVALLLTASVQAAALSDPTRPMDFAPSGGAAVARVAPAGPSLESTFVSATRKSAIISGKSVKVGDSYDGARITDITPYEVRMTRDGRESTLRLMPKLNKSQGRFE